MRKTVVEAIGCLFATYTVNVSFFCYASIFCNNFIVMSHFGVSIMMSFCFFFMPRRSN